MGHQGAFLQFSHLQRWVQGTPELKHSQYFLEQPVFLQLHPLPEDILGPKPGVVFSSISSIALARSSANSCLFWQFSQLQSWQKEPRCGWMHLGRSIRSRV